jgi:hypothetical protein
MHHHRNFYIQSVAFLCCALYGLPIHASEDHSLIRFHIPTWTYGTPKCDAPNHHIFFKLRSVEKTTASQNPATAQLKYQRDGTLTLDSTKPFNSRVLNSDCLFNDKKTEVSQHLRIVQIKPQLEYRGRSICTNQFLEKYDSPVVFTLVRVSGMECAHYHQSHLNDLFPYQPFDVVYHAVDKKKLTNILLLLQHYEYSKNEQLPREIVQRLVYDTMQVSWIKQ